MSETAFRYQDIAIFQVQLARRQDAVPLTRDYVHQREQHSKAGSGLGLTAPACGSCKNKSIYRLTVIDFNINKA
jgi:cyclopropane-fatty-acyl-phospholipid synthase